MLIDLRPGPAGSATWGGIGGTLANQLDLQAALNGKADLSAFVLLNAQEIFADAEGGDDTTGVGSLTFPFETLEKVLTLTTDTSKRYVVWLAPGDYSSGPVTIPSNVSIFGKNANITNPVTIDFIPAIESTFVYDGIGAEIIMDMSPSNISIATFRNGAYNITRLDNTTGPYFFSVNDSNITGLSLKGNGLVTNCVFLSTATVERDGVLLAQTSIIGINIDVIGTGVVSMTGCTFLGSITGTVDLGDTPEVRSDSSSLGYGGIITVATLTDLDSGSYISNIPYGPVTADKVQDAINQLADLTSTPASSVENCPDNTTTQIVIGSSSTKEVFHIDYVFELNVSFKKQIGKIILAYDPDEADVIFDHEEGVVGAEISGLTIDSNENAGNLRISVDLNSVGENAKFKYTVKSIDQIV